MIANPIAPSASHQGVRIVLGEEDAEVYAVILAPLK